MREREEEHEARLEALRCDIQVGLDELDRGEGIDGEPAFDRVIARIARYEDRTSAPRPGG